MDVFLAWISYVSPYHSTAFTYSLTDRQSNDNSDDIIEQEERRLFFWELVNLDTKLVRVAPLMS